MHPNLAPHNHPGCADLIRKLEECHRENKWKKFVGACNVLKKDLDDCLTEEVRTRNCISLL
jgi:hypothetical protein